MLNIIDTICYDMAQYDKDVITYKEWQRCEEIRKTEIKLRQLKGVSE